MLSMTSHKKQSLRSLFFGGLLPIVIYTILEEKVGPLWGLVFGMVFGLFEILFEAFRYRKVETVTWIGNGLLLGMGVISLVTQEGIWFKLQPALLELGMAILLWGSLVMGKPLLVMMADKQKTFESIQPEIASILRARFKGITFRLGIFFFIHSLIATYAAFFWSTRSWALLKGLGLTLTMLVYLGLEVFYLRRSSRVR